jgi:hypothetical protein
LAEFIKEIFVISLVMMVVLTIAPNVKEMKHAQNVKKINFGVLIAKTLVKIALKVNVILQMVYV